MFYRMIFLRWENRPTISADKYWFGFTNQTGQQIFALDGSNDTDLCKDVPFGGFTDIAPHLVGQIAQNS